MKQTSLDILASFRWNRDKRAEILHYFQQSDAHFNDLISLATEIREYPIQEHSSWLLNLINDLDPQKVAPFLPAIIDSFLASTNQSTLRNLLKTISESAYTAYRESELLDACISHAMNFENKVALQVYAIYHIMNCLKHYPELKQEIDGVIDQIAENDLSAALMIAVRKYRKLKI